jgi:hypothetical protein
LLGDSVNLTTGLETIEKRPIYAPVDKPNMILALAHLIPYSLYHLSYLAHYVLEEFAILCYRFINYPED